MVYKNLQNWVIFNVGRYSIHGALGTRIWDGV
jgi:hypothetical protein